jgi:predicted dehydrogenase
LTPARDSANVPADVGTELPTLADRDLQPLGAAPLRVGVVGLGTVAQAVHLPLLQKRDDLFRTVALCDLSASTRDAVGHRLGVPESHRFATAEELLAREELDAVAILSSGSHGELAAAAARAGLAVFCEKPLAYTHAELDRLEALDPTLMLGYMKVYDPAVERARALLADRPTARSVEVTVLHPPSAPQLAHAGLLPPAADVEPDVLERLRADERALVEQALGEDVPAELALLYTDVVLGSVVHDLAVIRYLLGGPLTFEWADAWPGSVALAGTLPQGTRVSIRWHYLERYPAYREEVRIHDDDGTVALAFPAPYLLYAPTTLSVVDGDEEAQRATRFRSTVEAFEREWLAFARFVHDGEPPRAGIAEGRADVVACQQAARLLAARAGVELGGETTLSPTGHHVAALAGSTARHGGDEAQRKE